MTRIALPLALTMVALSLGATIVLARLSSTSTASLGLRRLATTGFNPVGDSIFGPGHAFNATLRGNVQFGAAVALDSKTGTRLVVGAPQYDFANTTDTDDFGFVNTNGGAVFLFELDNETSTWTNATTPLWALYGDKNEGVGEFVGLDGDGHRVAIRRFNQVPHYVQVFDLPSGMQVGSNISCSPKRNGSPTNGDSFAMASSGNRLALQCKTSTGRVEVFDFDESLREWKKNGTLDGLSPRDLFGFASSFSDDANRLAIASPNGLGSGFFQVFDNTNGTWNQVGQRILGDDQGDQFGFGLHMSADGSSVVASAPSAEQLKGSVSVFSYNSIADMWIMAGNPVFGFESRDKFGRAIAISSDGKRFVASSWANTGARGHALLFHYNVSIGDWVEVATVSGDGRGDRLGFGRSGLSLAKDGIRLAVGETWTNNRDRDSVGRVLVMDASFTGPATNTMKLSAIPTAIPTALLTNEVTEAPVMDIPPTAHPGINLTTSPSAVATPIPTPSPSPGLTLPPSKATFKPSLAPTVFVTGTDSDTSNSSLGPFDWDIERTGDLKVDFAGDSQNNTEEVIFYYTIHHRPVGLQVFESDCQTPVDSIITAQAASYPLSDTGTHDLLKISLDIKQDSILESDLFIVSDSESGLLSLCTRVNLLDDENQAVVFHEQKLFITINLLSNFVVSAIDLVEDTPDEEVVFTDLAYGISACQCSPSFECASSLITQNYSVVYLCVFSSFSNIQIRGVRELQISQDGLSHFPITNGTLDNLTSVALLSPSGNESLAVIQTFLLSAFFDSAGDILASGSVSLAFVAGNGTTRRRLNAPISLHYKSTEDEETASFGVELGVVSNGVATSNPSGSSRAMFSVLSSMLLAGVTWAII